MVAGLDKIQSIREERRIIGMVGVQDMGKLVWHNSAAYFTALCLSVHAALSQVVIILRYIDVILRFSYNYITYIIYQSSPGIIDLGLYSSNWMLLVAMIFCLVKNTALPPGHLATGDLVNFLYQIY